MPASAYLSRTLEKEENVPRAALYEEVRELLDDGAQLVEVLPEAEYSELHLAGARDIPLKRLDAETTSTSIPLDRSSSTVTTRSET